MERTIMIIDDDIFYGQLIAYTLSQNTLYRTLHVQTGAQALTVARAIIPVLFLLDYRLPDMNGVVLYDQLRAIEGRAQVPAILLSADLPDHEIEAQLTMRKIIGMSKPGHMGHLRLTVDQLVINV